MKMRVYDCLVVTDYLSHVKSIDSVRGYFTFYRHLRKKKVSSLVSSVFLINFLTGRIEERRKMAKDGN